MVFTLLIFTYLSVRAFYNFAIGYDKGMSLIGGILFGAGAIFQAADLYEFIKKKKLGKSNSAEKSTSEWHNDVE